MKTTQLIAFIALLLCSAHLHAESRPSLQWLNRPWEIRYLIFIADIKSRITMTKISSQFNQEAENKVYLDGEALFLPHRQIAVPNKAISRILIAFDKDGNAKSADIRPGHWVAKRSILNNLVLIDKRNPTSPPYRIADFDQGIAGEMRFSPAVCGGWDFDRYSDDWDPVSMLGDFGCREWTAQLYDQDRPYIDVTTYSPYGTYIGESVGWSRFSDPPKPVIGKQGETWLCLHECPAGERPGIIRDMKKWTKKHGYPMPERPPKQPEYPNSDFKDSWQE